MSRVASIPPRVISLCAVLLLSMAPSRVAAQTPDAAVTARIAFDRGIAEARQERFAEAAAAFEESYRLRPVPVVLFNLAGAYDRMGRVRQALDHYLRYLHDAGSTVNSARSAQVQANIARLRVQLAVVQLELTPPTARVEVDGRDSVRTPDGLELEAGEHVVSVSAPGFVSQRQSLTLRLGERRALQVRLEPVAVEPAPTPAPAVSTTPAPLVTQPAEAPRPTPDPRVQVQPPTDSHETPVVRRWWFWTGIGAGIVGGAVAGMAAAGVFNVTASPPTGVHYAVDALSSRW